MKDGEICIFLILIDNDAYRVRCECYEDFFDGELAYSCTWYKNGEEIMHAGYAEMIDTLDKARDSIMNTIKLRETLLSRADEIWEAENE